MTTLAINRGRICARPLLAPSSRGMASSEVARNTASRVPREISPAAYRLEALAENPHWGIQPKAAPTRGPAFPMRPRVRSILSEL